jgi:hypothetical protein
MLRRWQVVKTGYVQMAAIVAEVGAIATDGTRGIEKPNGDNMFRDLLAFRHCL